jgi:hypothetical protein
MDGERQGERLSEREEDAMIRRRKRGARRIAGGEDAEERGGTSGGREGKGRDRNRGKCREVEWEGGHHQRQGEQ